MISYLIEAVLFTALVITAWRVTKMHRELTKLRRYESEFGQMAVQISDAFDNIAASVHDLNANGTQLVHLLGVKIDEARELMAEIDRRKAERPARTVEIGAGFAGERTYATCVPIRQSNG